MIRKYCQRNQQSVLLLTGLCRKMTIPYKTFYITLFEKHWDILERKLSKKEFFVLKRFLQDDQNPNRVALLFDTSHRHMLAVIRQCVLKMLCVYVMEERKDELDHLLSVLDNQRRKLFLSYITHGLNTAKTAAKFNIQEGTINSKLCFIRRDIVESFSFQEGIDPFWKVFFDVIKKKPKFCKGSKLLNNIRSRYDYT